MIRLSAVLALFLLQRRGEEDLTMDRSFAIALLAVGQFVFVLLSVVWTGVG